MEIDQDRMEEDWFLMLGAPLAGQSRTLSLDGARMLATEQSDAVARRHPLATARMGRSTACPFERPGDNAGAGGGLAERLQLRPAP